MITSINWKRLAALAVASPLAWAPAAAVAAPQVLALVATEEAVELACEGDRCAAEFSAFCLQPDRFAPARGTAYVLAGAAGIVVTGLTVDGREVRLEPREALEVTALRTHVAVRISIPRDRLEALGVARVAVSVNENASLLPVPVAGDPNPQSEAELALLTDQLRPLGARVVDRNGERMLAARITGRMINALPALGGDGADDAVLWQRGLGRLAEAAPGGEALTMARRALEFCDFQVRRTRHGTMRQCLQSHHDSFLRFLNSEYWQAVRTGS